jgi:MFS family permease
MIRLLPSDVRSETRMLLWGRGFRAFGDGFVSVLLPVYLTALGFSSFETGVLIAATLLGSAAASLAVGFTAHRFGRRAMLVAAALLMIGTGVGFLFETEFWPLVVIGFVGTLNPSSGDVSLFLPLEQALLAESAGDRSRTMVFAAYSLVGSLVAALGSLAAGVPDLLRAAIGLNLVSALQAMFAVYTVLGLATFYLYRRLPARLDRRDGARPQPLGPSRNIVLMLAGLFSLDAFAGGFVVQSLLSLWFFDRFGLAPAALGGIFFGTGLLSAASYLAAARIAGRIGLVNTMVFTHLPSNLFLILMPFAPSAGVAVALLMARSLLSQMDVPTRTSYVMAVVTPGERAAAASVTSVPRSLAAAVSPIAAGWLLTLSPFGWSIVAAGALKSIYDVLLLALFRRHKPPEEQTTEDRRQTTDN